MQRSLNRLCAGESATIRHIVSIDPKTRQRFAALGLTRGTAVTLLRTAPSGDPIAIRVRDCDLSLRKRDAVRILLDDAVKRPTAAAPLQQAVPIPPAAKKLALQLTRRALSSDCAACKSQKTTATQVLGESITVALAGNPNCGKTTLFNALTGARESVGNWPGVTVDRRERRFSCGKHVVRLVDLPGIYSLSNDTAEERAAKAFLTEETPDIIINIVDAAHLSRHLYLTLQLMQLGKPMLLALNMMDEAERNGQIVDVLQLSELLGIPVVPLCARSGQGICAMLSCLSSLADAKDLIQPTLSTNADAASDAALLYDRTERICSRCIRVQGCAKQRTNERWDALVTHHIFGIPIFLLLMGAIFLLTFDTLGAYLTDGMDRLIAAGLKPIATKLLHALHAPTLLESFVLSGILGGVGSVLAFLPQVALLFFFLSLLEDSGYLARAAFLTDRTLRRFGLSGKSCIPLLMGFGCTVPAALATRTLERDSDRRMTLLLLPYVSCSAKLPVYGMLASALFQSHRGLVVLSLYALGLLLGSGIGTLLHRTRFSSDDSAFVLELPPYRRPTLRNTLLHVGDRVEHFLKRAGTVILLMNLLLWALVHLDGALQPTADPANSLLGRFGSLLAPVFSPLGFGHWQAAVALLTGLAAKEAVTASLALFVGTAGSTQAATLASLFSPLSAYTFLVFVLLSLPCAAAITTIAREQNHRRDTVLFLLLQTVIAYGTSFVIYTLGRLLGF